MQVEIRLGTIHKSVAWAFAIVTGIFIFVPEAFFGEYEWVTQDTLEHSTWLAHLDAQDINIVISRIVCFLLIGAVTLLVYLGFLKLRRWITIKGQNYSIRVEYGNILKKKNCKRIISLNYSRMSDPR